MAFITYRASTTPTLATATTLATGQLTNLQIDANFKALDAGKLETNGSAASLTGLPLTTGVTGILPVANGGTGSSTASTGSGGVVLATSPTLVTANLGTPAYLNLTNAINFPLDGTATVTGKLPIAFGGTNATATPTAGAVPYGTGTAYAFTGVGTIGQVLTSAGAGTPTWTTVTTSAGGSNTQVQYNSSGSFAGSANMTFNGTTLALNSLSVSTTLDVTGVSTLTGGAVIQGLTVGLGANAVAGNTAVGGGALNSASLSGAYNVAVGYSALNSTTSGGFNSAIGLVALYTNTTGARNVAVGGAALASNDSGNNNVGIGYEAGRDMTGNNNTIIGSVAGTAGISDTVIIAAGQTERIRINSSGNVGIGTTSPGSKLTVVGQIESTTTGFKFPDGTTQATAATGGGAWTKITAAVTATTKKQYVTDTIAGGAFTVTLPATPAAGDYVYFMDAGDWFTYNLTVARNGSTIEGLSSNLVLDVKGLMVQMIYDGSTWQVTSNIGPQGPTGPAAGVGKIIAMAMIFGG